MPLRVEPFGAEVDHDVRPGERRAVGAAAGPVAGLQHHHVVARFEQVTGGHQAGEAGSDHDNVIPFGFAHVGIVTR